MSQTQLCSKIRIDVLKRTGTAGFGHLGGTFSVVEILVALFSLPALSLLPSRSAEQDNDYFILSKGHACLAYYSLLHSLGALSEEALDSYGVDGGLGAQLDTALPGVAWNTGSLGHSVGVATGMAISQRSKGRAVICLVGDAELSEGSMWEAFHLAAEQKLSNLLVIVDSNGLSVSDEFSMPRLGDRMRSFGWNFVECDGHSIPQLHEAIGNSLTGQKPTLISAQTVKGRGVGFMESNPSWHHGSPTPEQFSAALEELEKSGRDRNGGH